MPQTAVSLFQYRQQVQHTQATSPYQLLASSQLPPHLPLRLSFSFFYLSVPPMFSLTSLNTVLVLYCFSVSLSVSFISVLHLDFLFCYPGSLPPFYSVCCLSTFRVSMNRMECSNSDEKSVQRFGKRNGALQRAGVASDLSSIYLPFRGHQLVGERQAGPPAPMPCRLQLQITPSIAIQILVFALIESDVCGE